MLRKKSLGIILTSLLLFCTLMLWQNCGQHKTSNSPLPPSPFEGNKVVFTEDFAKQQKLTDANGTTLLASAVIPMATEISVIIRDKCLRERMSEVNRLPYWIDSYIDTNTPLGNVDDYYSETAVGIVTRKEFLVGDLENYAKLDPCVVGVSNTTRITYRAASQPATTAEDMLAALKFTQADTLFQSKIPNSIKVRVALLESGIDNNNAALTAYVDPTYNAFYDFLGGTMGVKNSQGTQDLLGLGTQMASLIVGDSSQNFKGLASRNVTLLPIKIRNSIDQGFGSYNMMNMIKLAVNMRADVINIAAADLGSCSPVVGHAFLQAVRRNAFIVLSAGDNIETDTNKPRKPGSFLTVKDNGPRYDGLTVMPACWGRYLKGVLTVTATNSAGTSLTSFSNWGNDSVEIGAPGISISAIHTKGQKVISDSIVLPTAMVSSAVAMTIAYHKAQGWSYDPWLIEDVLLNSLPTQVTLTNAIRLGKFINFKSLADYLQSLESKTAEQRLAEFTDNPELNGGWNASSAVDSNFLALDFYAKSPTIQINKRLQMNTVAYYKDAVIKVVTDSATYSSSDASVAEINSQGVVIGKKAGNAILTATYQGTTKSVTVSVVNYDVIYGPRDELVDLEISWSQGAGRTNCPVRNESIFLSAYAIFADGSRIPVTSFTSWAMPNAPAEAMSGFSETSLFAGHWYGGKTYTVYGLYRGLQKKMDIVAPQQAYKQTALQVFGNLKLAYPNVELYPNNGTPLSISQDKKIMLSAYIESLSGCTYSYPNKAFVSSPDPTLNALLQPNNAVLDLNQLSVDKIYEVNVNFGVYRGNGTDETLPPKKYFITITPPDIKDLRITQDNKSITNFVAGINSIGFSSMDSSGEWRSQPLKEFSVQFYDTISGERQRAPYAWFDPQDTCVPPSCQLNFYPTKVGSWNLRMDVTHLSTGFKKSIPITVQTGEGIYNGLYAASQAFSWDRFSMLTNTTSCPQGDATPLQGLGTNASPFVICTAQQFAEQGYKTTNLKSAPVISLGRDIDLSLFTPTPNKTLVFAGVLGKGFGLKNLTFANGEFYLNLMSANYFSNLHLKNFNITTRGIGLFSGDAENIIISDSTLIAQEGGAVLFLNAKNVKDVRLDNVELQGTTIVSPISAVTSVIIKNFGSRNLRLRTSSVPGTGVIFSGLLDNCNGCVIMESTSSGTIAQASGRVGGIVGQMGPGILNGVSSDMNISVSSSSSVAGGIVARAAFNAAFVDVQQTIETFKYSLLRNVQFSGSVRGPNNIGGLVGYAKNITIEDASVSSTAVVQAVNNVGGAVGNSFGFNRFYNLDIQANIFSSGGIAHPIAVTKKFNDIYNFRSADLFSNIKYKNISIPLEPVLEADLVPIGAPASTAPAPKPLPEVSLQEAGINITFPGSIVSNGVYILNRPSATKGSESTYVTLQITSAQKFCVMGGEISSAVAFDGPISLTSDSDCFKSYIIKFGLPTGTVGTIDAANVLRLSTAIGTTTLKMQIRGTVTP